MILCNIYIIQGYQWVLAYKKVVLYYIKFSENTAQLSQSHHMLGMQNMSQHMNTIYHIKTEYCF